MAKIKMAKTDPVILDVMRACVQKALQPYVDEIVKGLLDSRQIMLLQGYVRDVLKSGDLINVPVPEVAETPEVSPSVPETTPAVKVEKTPTPAPSVEDTVEAMVDDILLNKPTTEAAIPKETLETFLEANPRGWSAPHLPKVVLDQEEENLSKLFE